MVGEQRTGSSSARSTSSGRAHDKMDTSIGKRTLIESLPDHDEARTSSSVGDNELGKLRHDIKYACLGTGSILDSKREGADNMKDYLSGPDTATESSFLGSALSIGAEVAVVALVPLTDGTTEAIVATLVEGSNLVAHSFHDDNGVKNLLLNPIKLGSHYHIALGQHWPKAVNNLLNHATNVEKATRIWHHIHKIRHEPTRTAVIQQNEILDAWVNALKAQTQGGSTKGMGNASFKNAAAGHLHIRGVKLHPQAGGRPTLDIGNLTAELLDVADLARNLILGRRINKIHVTRTIEGFVTGESTRILPPSREFAFGVLLDGKPTKTSADAIDPGAHDVLKSFG